jgi:hypothetical protein
VSARGCLIVEGGATLRGTPILFRGALLPLSEGGVAIDNVLGAVNHRALLPEEALRTRNIRRLWVCPRSRSSIDEANEREFEGRSRISTEPHHYKARHVQASDVNS